MQLLFKFNSKLAAFEENPKFLPKSWKEAASKKHFQESLIYKTQVYFHFYCRLVLASGKISKSQGKKLEFSILLKNKQNTRKKLS